MKTALFACIHNAGRSQMAAAWFNALADRGKASAVSAGTEPGARVHPEVQQAMREVGIELEGIKPQKLTDELAAQSSILITMGCGEACPYVPGLRRMDWPLEDPKGKPVERVREIRDEVKERILGFLQAEGWLSSFRIRAARVEEREALLRLLDAAKLPLQGVEEGFPEDYSLACLGDQIVGAAGLEQYGAAGLLRSVIVHPAVRGQGLGRALVEDRLERARRLGLERIFLLTTSAEAYFRALGFSPAARAEAPVPMLDSAEFAGACPASATCLARAP